MNSRGPLWKFRNIFIRPLGDIFDAVFVVGSYTSMCMGRDTTAHLCQASPESNIFAHDHNLSCVWHSANSPLTASPPRRTQQKCHNRRTPDTILCMTSRNIAFCCSNWPKMGSIGMRNRRSACVWDTCCHTQVVYLWHRIRQVIEMTAGSVSSVRERTHEKCRQPRARGLWDYYTI